MAGIEHCTSMSGVVVGVRFSIIAMAVVCCKELAQEFIPAKVSLAHYSMVKCLILHSVVSSCIKCMVIFNIFV